MIVQHDQYLYEERIHFNQPKVSRNSSNSLASIFPPSIRSSLIALSSRSTMMRQLASRSPREERGEERKRKNSPSRYFAEREKKMGGKRTDYLVEYLLIRLLPLRLEF